MIWMRVFLTVILTLAVPGTALAKTYKTTYPNACSEVWVAVKDTLSNTENYNVVSSDDVQMTATYQPKHSVHVTITGAALQRRNHVTLVTKGTGCEMQVVSNYSGFEHNDREDFKTRVDEALAKPRSEIFSQPAKTPAAGW